MGWFYFSFFQNPWHQLWRFGKYFAWERPICLNLFWLAVYSFFSKIFLKLVILFKSNEEFFSLCNNFLCPVHLPRQNIFCPGQNQICPRQNNFVNDKIFFVHDKNFVHSLKIIFALRKLVWSHGQNFCPGQKIFCHGQN